MLVLDSFAQQLLYLPLLIRILIELKKTLNLFPLLLELRKKCSRQRGEIYTLMFLSTNFHDKLSKFHLWMTKEIFLSSLDAMDAITHFLINLNLHQQIIGLKIILREYCGVKNIPRTCSKCSSLNFHKKELSVSEEIVLLNT